MLTAAGPGLAALKDYTQRNDPANNPQIQQQQGDTLDTYKFIISDNTNSATIAAEDDCIVLDETDVNGWPSLNLLQNPSFEGTYSGTFSSPPFWGTPNMPTGVTGAKATSTAPTSIAPNTSAWQISFSNAPITTGAVLLNAFTLPTDEFGNPLLAAPYTFSLWYTGAGLVNIQPYIVVEWWTANFASRLGTTATVNLQIQNFGWLRGYVAGTAPAGTVSAKVLVGFNITSATNSGNFYLDSAQFECQTFYRDAAWPPYYPVQNPNMQGTVGAQTANVWVTDQSATGVTYNVVSAPSLFGTAQQISINSPAQSSATRGIALNNLLLDTTGQQTYMLALQLQVTQALTNGALARLGVNLQDGGHGFLTDYHTDVPVQQNNQWQTITLMLGAGTSHPLTAGAQWLKIYCGIIANVSSSSTGTIVIGQVTCTRMNLAAGASAIYPTPYIDNAQPGCYTDTGRSGLYYRHLRLFGGFVKTRDNDYTSSVERSVQVSCVDYGTLLAEAPFTGLFQQIQDTAAIAQAVTYAQQQGYLVGLDASTFVQAIGKVDSQAFTMNTMRDVMNYVSNQTVASYWVDPYIRLHYTQALAISAPFALSDQPDMVNTYPFTDAVFSSDSTNAATEPVIEGGSQVSAPQTYTGTGTNATLSAALASGTNYSALTVNALTVAVPGGTIVTINVGGGTTQQVTTSAQAQVGATSIPVNSFNANANYAINTPVAVGTLFTVYGGNNIHFVDSATANSVSLVVGLASNDQLGAGSPTITAVYAPNGGTVQLLTAIGASQGITVVFRFDAPVLVRVHAPGAESGTGAIRRKIFVHTKLANITSKSSAIDRANADNAQNAKAKPVVTLSVWTPPTPTGTVLRPGMAIQLTHRIEGYSAVLMQIQQVTTLNVGNGIMVRQLQLGFYRPDAIILLAQVARDSLTSNSSLSTDSVLQDVLSSSDGWAMTDSPPHATVQNIGKWGGVTSSTWGGTYVWG